MKLRLIGCVALLWLPAAAVHGQSVFNSAGMGLPAEALDGRARALGNLGIGLQGGALLPTDPAALARYVLPTGVMAGQPSWVDYARDDGESGSFQGNRFPLMGLAYPAFSGMVSVQVGSFLDQRFASESPGSVLLQGEPVQTVDRFEQDGSVSNLNVGYARMLGERTAVGATVGRYAGSVVRALTRSFEESVAVEDYVEEGKWSYAGYSVTLGVSSQLMDELTVAGSVQVPTALDASASESTGGQNGTFDLPMQLRFGATARLAPGLLLTGSAAFADWSGAEDDLRAAASAGNANGFGVGLELSRARLLGKQAPLRFGFRRSGLPFSFEGSEATERVYSGGLGLVLNETGEFVLAGVDLGIERGLRSGGGITENFWRATLSLVVSGS